MGDGKEGAGRRGRGERAVSSVEAGMEGAGCSVQATEGMVGEDRRVGGKEGGVGRSGE